MTSGFCQHRRPPRDLVPLLLVLIAIALGALIAASAHGAEPLRLPELPFDSVSENGPVERRRPRPRPSPSPAPLPSPSPDPRPGPPSTIDVEMPRPESSNPGFEAMQLEAEQRKWFYNFTNPGSCVQCSIAMCGVHCNVPAASTLLWDTEYGEKVWHGSWPQRVAQYCDERRIEAWNVTGETTWDWMRWSAKTGRFAAIGAGVSHFQTLYGYDPRSKTWLVCNNQTPGKIDRYSDAAFRRLHLASGQWCVILKRSSSAPPRIVEWWK